MDQIRLSRYKIPLMILIFTTLVITAQSASPKFSPCLPSSCGNGPEIRYPFWIPQQQEPHCGSPQFNITCHDKNPILKISDDDYIVKNISYADHSILLANSEFFDDKNSCPTPLHNFSISGIPFESGLDFEELHFFYNCSFEDKSARIILECASNPTHHSFAVFHTEFLKKEYSVDKCQATVTLPITDVDTSTVNMSYTEIMRKGFALKWNGDDCSKCVKSGGRCGSVDNNFTCICNDQAHSRKCGNGNSNKLQISKILGPVFAVVGIVTGCLIVYAYKKQKKLRTAKGEQFSNQNVEDFVRNYEALTTQRYSNIKKMTNSFKEKLGQGGFGRVYKGKFADGRQVAVKVLNETQGNGEEFINEVASISRTSHVNVVTLLGFCFERNKRALIYEFMPNKSLDKFIYDDQRSPDSSQHLDIDILYQITVGIARGLEYLHRGCNTRIVHFDIKPQNILLDEDFCPKISDFGLAKLCKKKESVISILGARGTAGYIAPEVFNRNFGRVSHKSDVYSYGMMVLEMAGASKNNKSAVARSSESYFSDKIYENLENDSCLDDVGHQNNEEERKATRKMILVGLWCIQTSPADRPSMSKVVEMLEGSVESLQVPPKPLLHNPTMSLHDYHISLQLMSENDTEATNTMRL